MRVRRLAPVTGPPRGDANTIYTPRLSHQGHTMPNVIPHPYEGSDVYCEHCALPPHNRHHTQHAVIVTPPTGHEQVVVGFDTEQEAADWAATHVPRVAPGPQPWKTCVAIHESVYDTDTDTER